MFLCTQNEVRDLSFSTKVNPNILLQFECSVTIVELYIIYRTCCVYVSVHEPSKDEIA